MAAATSRSRNITRKFILLRWVDPLRVPSARNLDALERSGRVKELIFTNNSTCSAITELILKAFGQHLAGNDMMSLFFYKPVGSTNILTEVCSGREVCGPTLKLHFKNGKKIYMRQTIAVGNQNDHMENQVRAEAPGAELEEDENDQGNRDEVVVDYESLAVPGTSGEDTARNTAGTISPVNISDEDDELLHPLHSTPRPRSNSHLTDTNSMATNRLSMSLYDKIVQVPVVTKSANELTLWEKHATEVGEICDQPNLLYGAEIGKLQASVVFLTFCDYPIIFLAQCCQKDSESGPAHDIRIFEQLLCLHQVAQALPVLCLPPLQVRLQTNHDAVPACIIRYRPTKEAAEILRNLMLECETTNRCYIYVALMGSKFDKEVSGVCTAGQEEQHIEIRVFQPTMSSSRMVVGDVVSGNNPTFIFDVNRAVHDALQAAGAVRYQRDLIIRNRELRETQDRELRASKMEDMRKELQNQTTAEASDCFQVTREPQRKRQREANGDCDDD